MGRAAAGVKGITLEPSDAVVALAVVVPDAALLVAGENGIGKRTPSMSTGATRAARASNRAAARAASR